MAAVEDPPLLLAAALNYPHVRVWSGVFTQIETPEEFAEISRRGQSQLEAEGWHHTTTASAGGEKERAR